MAVETRHVLVALAGVLPLLVHAARAHGAGPESPSEFGPPELEEITALESAEEVPGAAEKDQGSLILSASRIPVPIDEAPAIVTIVTPEDLADLGARTVVEGLRTVPELDVTRDAFGFYHVAIRGRKADPEVLVLLDGHRLNDFYDGRILYDIPLSIVDRVEIIRGPGSALYGTNAFAGVISIFSRRGTNGTLNAQVRTWTEGGDKMRFQPSAVHATAYASPEVGPLRLAFTLEGSVAGGPKLLVIEDSLTRNRFDPDTGLPQGFACSSGVDACPDTAFTKVWHRAVRAALRVDRKPGFLVADDTLTAVVHGFYHARGPLIAEFDTLTPDTTLETSKVFGGLGYELPLGSTAVRLGLSSSFDVTDIDRQVQVAPDGFKELVGGRAELFPEGELKRIRYLELLLREEARLFLALHARLRLVVGADLEHTALPHYELLTNYDDTGRRQPTLANYLGTDFDQDGRTRTVLGLYFESLLNLPLGFRVLLGGRYDHYTDFGDAVSPRAAVVWRYGGLSIKAFYGWAFRAPTFEELYDQSNAIDLGGFLGSPSLEASTIKTLEAGAAYLFSWPELLLSLGVTGFSSAISDSIDRAPVSGLSNPLLNSSDVGSRGFSGEARAELFRRTVVLFGNMSWFEATSHYAYADPAGSVNIKTDTPLTSVPQLRANLGLRVAFTKTLKAGALLESSGPRKNDRRTPLEQLHFYDYPSYNVLSLFARVDGILDRFAASLFLDNVTDARIADEPFRPNRMPQGVPRDRFRATLLVSAAF